MAYKRNMMDEVFIMKMMMMRSFCWKVVYAVSLFGLFEIFRGFEMPSISLLTPNNPGEKPRQRGRSFHGIKPRSSSFSSERPKKPSRAFSCIEITPPLCREWKTSFLKNYEVLPDVPNNENLDEREIVDVSSQKMFIYYSVVNKPRVCVVTRLYSLLFNDLCAWLNRAAA